MIQVWVNDFTRFSYQHIMGDTRYMELIAKSFPFLFQNPVVFPFNIRD